MVLEADPQQRTPHSCSRIFFVCFDAAFCFCLLRAQSLKLEALLFLRLSMDKHPPFVFHATVQESIKHVTACVKEDWYKVRQYGEEQQKELEEGEGKSTLT